MTLDPRHDDKMLRKKEKQKTEQNQKGKFWLMTMMMIGSMTQSADVAANRLINCTHQRFNTNSGSLIKLWYVT